MKAVASKINREGRGVLKAISASQGTEPVLPREYQDIFKSNGKPMVILDEDTTISLANAEFERLCGYTKTEIEGTKKWTEFVAREDRRRMKEYHLLRKSDPMLTPRCSEFRFVDRYGKIKNIVLTIGQIRGTTRSMASLQDVTARRQAEVTQHASEERYQTFFENSRDAVYITTSDGTYVDANRAALDLFGYTREEIKKLKARQLYANPVDARRLRKEMEEKGFAQDFEVRLRKKDGTEMDCQFTVTALRGDDGSILEYQGIARDMTERKRAVEALRKSEEKYRNIFGSMLEGYFEVDLAGNVTFFNEAVSKFHGFSGNELIGLNYREFTSPKEAQRLFQVFSDVYKTGNPREIDDYEMIKKDGSIGIAEFSVSLLRNAAGEPIGFRGVTRDVTEKRKTNGQLQQSEERYRTILEDMDEGYFEIDLAGNFTFVNDSLCRKHGYPKEKMIGMNNREYTDKENAKKVFEAFSQIYRTGEPGRVFDYELIRKDGTKRQVEVSASLKRDPSGNAIGFKGISRDITERKQMEVALRQSEEKYRTILESIEDGYGEMDLQGKITFFNDALPRILGYPKDELKNLNYKNRQYMDKANAEKVYQAYTEAYTTGKPNQGFQYEIIDQDGTRRYLESSISIRKDADGQSVGFRGVVRDITERKKIEEALRRSEERYRTIHETMQEAYYETDLAGHITFLNDALCKHLGYSKEEAIGMDFRQYQDEANAKKTFEAFNEIYKTGEPIKAREAEYIRKNGTKGTYELSVSLLRDAQGKPIGFRGVSRDVTERKQAEETLRQSEERYRNILENMQEAYYEIDLAGHVTLVNNAGCRNLGYHKEELIGMNYRQFQDEANAKKTYPAFIDVYRTGKPLKALDSEYVRKDGTKGTYELSASLIRDAQGKPIGFRGVLRDITERKKAEEALRRSEEKYRTILETIEDGYGEMDLQGKITFFNDALPRILGYPKDELNNLDYKNRQYMDEENAEKVHQAYTEVYTTAKPNRGFQYEIIAQDGTKRYLEGSVSLRKNTDGQPLGFQGVARDITERKQAEEQLRQSEERYRSILETMQEAYYETDLAGHFTSVNDALCGHLGYTKEELIGMGNRQYQDETTAKKTYQLYNEIYRTGEPLKVLDSEYVRKDGTKGTYELSASLIRDAQGKPIGFRGVSRDITERKWAEEALRRSEERYRTIIENIQDGYFENDLAGNFTFANDSLCKSLGYTSDELIGMNYQQYTEKENQKKVLQAYNKLYTTGEPVKGLEYEVITKDGAKAFTEISVSLIRDAQGKPIGFRGVSRDVTERKQAEEKLRQSEERYRTIIETMQEAYYENDLASNFTFVNDALCRHLGYTKEELIGTTSLQYQDEANAKKTYQAFIEIYRTGKPLKTRETEFISKDGTKRIYEISASLIRDAEGKPIGFRGVSRDINERKKAEEQLKRYAAELERSNEEVKNFAYIVSHDLRVPLVNLKGYTSELRTALGVIGSNFDAALPHLNDEKRSEVAIALHEDVPEALEFITNSVSRMDSFINAILILSRLGRQDLKPEPIDMSALVKTTLETMSHQIKERGIEVIVGSLPHVVADRTAMERTMGNILSNAVKYADSSRPCRIEVAAETKNGEAIFSIRDTGRGIAQEDMHKVFAPFRRAGKQDTQGEGMGLAYVQTLVRRHGGRIWCESEVGKGTTFTFTISTTFKQGVSDD